MGPGGRLGVVLHAKGREFPVAQSGNRVVVEVPVGDNQVIGKLFLMRREDHYD